MSYYSSHNTTSSLLFKGAFAALCVFFVAVIPEASADVERASLCEPLQDPYVLPIENPFELYAVKTQPVDVERANFRPRLGKYYYQVTWQGIPAAEIYVNVRQNGLSYVVDVDVRSSTLVEVFYKLRYQATSFLSAIDFSPSRTDYYQRENSREKITQVLYREDGTIESQFWSKNREPGATRFAPISTPMDPFSAAFLARSLDWWEGRSVTFDTYNGKTRYLITLTATDRQYMKLNGRMRDIWVISPTVRKSHEATPHSKLESAKIYVTADSYQEILKVESKVFVGTVETTLRSFTPARELPSGVQYASNEKDETLF